MTDMKSIWIHEYSGRYVVIRGEKMSYAFLFNSDETLGDGIGFNFDRYNPFMLDASYDANSWSCGVEVIESDTIRKLPMEYLQ